MKRQWKRLIKFLRQRACLQRCNFIFSSDFMNYRSLAHTEWVWCYVWNKVVKSRFLFKIHDDVTMPRRHITSAKSSVLSAAYSLLIPSDPLATLALSSPPFLLHSVLFHSPLFSLVFFVFFLYLKSYLQDRSFRSWTNREGKYFHQNSVNLSEYK